MIARSILAALVLSAATLAPAASLAASSTPATPDSGCVFQKHHIVSVTPYTIEERRIKTTVKRLAGAQLFIEAEPGLTPEWLRLQVDRHVDAMRSGSSMGGCPLDVGEVRVEVDPAGRGFRVNLIAADPNQADEVLRRARTLVG